MSARLVPVPGSAALLLEPTGRKGTRTLIVSDVHLGLGATADRPAGPVEGSGVTLADALVRVARAAAADAVVVAGDAKHPIVGTPRALRPIVFDFFARLLAEGLAAELVLGNHDVGIVPSLPREVAVHPADGIVRDGVGIFHGHRWPAAPLLRASRLVAGHLHPGYRLAPTAGDPEGKRRCWVRVEVPATPRTGEPRRRPQPRAREIVILPAFNPLAGTEALNRERPARGRTFLYRRFLALGIPRAYLLDGTDLGPLPMPVPSGPASQAAAGARPGR